MFTKTARGIRLVNDSEENKGSKNTSTTPAYLYNTQIYLISLGRKGMTI